MRRLQLFAHLIRMGNAVFLKNLVYSAPDGSSSNKKQNPSNTHPSSTYELYRGIGTETATGGKARRYINKKELPKVFLSLVGSLLLSFDTQLTTKLFSLSPEHEKYFLSSKI